MSFFKKLNWQVSDAALLRQVKKLTGKDWSTDHDYVKRLRNRLLDLQNWRCVYCQAPISSDENGFRELEHILPKKASPNYSLPNATSNEAKHRRNTGGYSSFTYEPKNLAISCKQCNTNKGTYDPLRNRSRAPKYYPRPSAFEWFHPYWDEYARHIKINTRDWTYSKVTDEGDKVITVCKLDKADTLARKFSIRAQVRTRHAKPAGLGAALYSVATSVIAKEFGKKQAVDSLVDNFLLSEAEARQLFALWIARIKKDTAAVHAQASAALAVVRERLKRRK